MLVCAIMCRTFHNQKKSIYHSLIKGGDFSFLWKVISEKMSSFSSSLPNVKGHQLEKMFNTPFHAVYKPAAFRNLHFPGHCVLPFIWIFSMPDSEPLYLLSKFSSVGNVLCSEEVIKWYSKPFRASGVQRLWPFWETLETFKETKLGSIYSDGHVHP